MNYFSRYKYAIWTIVLLAVIIITALITGFYDHHRGGFEKEHKGGQMLKKELGLSDAQMVKIKKLHDEFIMDTHPIFDQLDSERIFMLRELAAKNPDTTKLFGISDKIGFLHAKLKRETIIHLLEIREICTPEQIAKLSNLDNRLIAPEGPPHRQHSDSH